MFRGIFDNIFKKKTEIQKVEAALKRYYNYLDEINADFDPTRDCCVDCMSGRYNIILANKIKRVEKWLEILKKRKENEKTIRKHNKRTNRMVTRRG